jgi:Tol biopolymer transport system component
MPRHLLSIRLGALSGAALFLFAACTDAARISAPSDTYQTPNATPSKQGPTSARLLYIRVATLESEPEIYSMDDDGTNVTRLTLNLASDVDPTWAPDGKRVFFASDRIQRAAYAIYVMNADGSATTQLSKPSPTQIDRQPQALGKRVVFVRQDLATDQISLWVMNDDGSDLTRLTTSLLDLSPAPSPSGKLVAFERGRDIHVVDVETGDVRNLTNTPDVDEMTPAWSTSGKLIAFARRDAIETHTDLYVMNVDGSGIVPVTNTPNDDETGPRWSPDGRRIAFSANYGGFYGVWTIGLDGTALNDLSLTHTPFVVERVGAWAR